MQNMLKYSLAKSSGGIQSVLWTPTVTAISRAGGYSQGSGNSILTQMAWGLPVRLMVAFGNLLKLTS